VAEEEADPVRRALEDVHFAAEPGGTGPVLTLTGSRLRTEGSITGSIPTAYWSSCKSSRQKTPRFARLLQSPLTDSNRRPPPCHSAPTRNRRASAGTRGHENPAKPRNRLSASDRAWTRVPGLVFPQCSLGGGPSSSEDVRVMPHRCGAGRSRRCAVADAE
jgi:hypothetical protein